MAKKSGLLPVFENQKWAEKFEGIFSKRHFFGVFCPFLGDLRKFEKIFCKKAHLPTFISYLIAIKNFNIINNKASKVGFWPRTIFHSTKKSICQELFTKSPFLFRQAVL